MHSPFPALLVGLIFGAGLALSDMINPARVRAFLDIAGAWDPTLGFVMGGAIVPSAIAYAISRRMRRPLLGGAFFIPENRRLDPQFVPWRRDVRNRLGPGRLLPGPCHFRAGPRLLAAVALRRRHVDRDAFAPNRHKWTDRSFLPSRNSLKVPSCTPSRSHLLFPWGRSSPLPTSRPQPSGSAPSSIIDLTARSRDSPARPKSKPRQNGSGSSIGIFRSCPANFPMTASAPSPTL